MVPYLDDPSTVQQDAAASFLYRQRFISFLGPTPRNLISGKLGRRNRKVLHLYGVDSSSLRHGGCHFRPAAEHGHKTRDTARNVKSLENLVYDIDGYFPQPVDEAITGMSSDGTEENKGGGVALLRHNGT